MFNYLEVFKISFYQLIIFILSLNAYEKMLIHTGVNSTSPSGRILSNFDFEMVA